MPRAAETRLARLESRADQGDDAARQHRSGLRFTVAMCGWIRAAALAAGIDPATIRALQQGEAAAAELAALGDTPELQRQDSAAADANTAAWETRHTGEPDPREILFARLQRLASPYADGGSPAPEDPPAIWLAWALCAPRRAVAA